MTGAGVGLGVGVGCEGGRLKLSSPGNVCAAVPLPVCAAAGAIVTIAMGATAVAIRKGIVRRRTPRKLVIATTASRAATNRPAKATGRTGAQAEVRVGSLLDVRPLTASNTAPIWAAHHSFSGHEAPSRSASYG
ncbi:hypothetical protein WR25_17005 [Diploscapter pachys]|uniref:Uncharacterized protein n=1 Tax=Diploscapter pachys TaxID=2018661 RepID=A0A2A2M483_9BILA|nr:hypothetical protein WR25_17005 [Diploscapter pachys]